jgi:hypothetical protein
MRVASDMSLKSRVTRMLWMANAMGGMLFMLLGGVMLVNFFGYEPQLAPMMTRTGVTFTLIGGMLALYSFSKARSIHTR